MLIEKAIWFRWSWWFIRRTAKSKQKQTLCNQIIKGFPLFKSDIVLRNTRWMYLGITLCHFSTPQYTYHDYLKVLVKPVSELTQQNQETDIDIVNDQHVKCGTHLL